MMLETMHYQSIDNLKLLKQLDKAKNKKEAVSAAKKIGYPVVLKIASPQIIHKSDAGGVKVNLQNKKDVEKAFDTIITNAKKYNKKADIKGVLVVEMVKGGKEMIIGSKSIHPSPGTVKAPSKNACLKLTLFLRDFFNISFLISFVCTCIILS